MWFIALWANHMARITLKNIKQWSDQNDAAIQTGGKPSNPIRNLTLLISKSWHALGFILVVTANFNLNQLPDYNISKIPEAHKILNTNNLR